MKDYANYYLPLKLQIWWNYMSAWMRFCMCAHMVCQYSMPHIILLPIAPAFFIFSLANVYNTCCLGQCTIVTHVCCTIVLWGIINEGCIYKCILSQLIIVIVVYAICVQVSHRLFICPRERLQVLFYVDIVDTHSMRICCVCMYIQVLGFLEVTNWWGKCVRKMERWTKLLYITTGTAYNNM